ncbi:Uncharacterised protein [Mycobacteroides abscessus subsp. massiliense]|uniref:DUF6378 domain-containing protein n=1 Tax=Mycobacteroides abscessus TaxID=36809 RepID=UPI0009C89FFC|nr:DUF6378 domain-containing protein [Mycobacteroides abscessus]SKM98678.1 Uncharacterised protein [Mycobacteroides abscessus subsp. massiliense]
MTSESILQEAERIINGDRAEQYGDAAESFADIAKRWTIELEDRLSAPVTALDVARMMTQLKMSRSRSSYHRDSYVDGAGYLGLTEKLADTAKAEPRVWEHWNEVPRFVQVRNKFDDLYEVSPSWAWCWVDPSSGRLNRSHIPIASRNLYGPFTEVL